MSKVKIKKNDWVVVITGKDKGKKGSILKVQTEKCGRVRVLVEGANLLKKHVKPDPQKNVSGGVQEREGWVDVSNVMLLDKVTNRGSRLGYREIDGKKVRYFKKSKELVEGV